MSYRNFALEKRVKWERVEIVKIVNTKNSLIMIFQFMCGRIFEKKRNREKEGESSRAALFIWELRVLLSGRAFNIKPTLSFARFKGGGWGKRES